MPPDPKRQDVEVWEHVSDIDPLWQQPWWVLRDRAARRYIALGGPRDRLLAWLDDHNVFPKRGDLDTRVRALPREGLMSLLYTLEDWATEKNPPHEDTV